MPTDTVYKKFKIFKVIDGKEEDLEAFKAESFAAAKEHLEHYILTKNAAEGSKYCINTFKDPIPVGCVPLYFKAVYDFAVTTDDGSETKSFSSYSESQKWLRSKRGLLKSIWHYVVNDLLDDIVYYVWTMPQDWIDFLRCKLHLLKHGISECSIWNTLDSHLIDSIIKVVPYLIEHSHGVQWNREAVIEVAGNGDPNFDVAKWESDHDFIYSDKVMKRAAEMQNAELNYLLLNARLYKYYSDCAIIDRDNPEEVLLDLHWHHTLPLVPGSYDIISDYFKLSQLAQERWDNVWDWIKKYGQRLWD